MRSVHETVSLNLLCVVLVLNTHCMKSSCLSVRMLARVLQSIYKKGIYDEKKESGGMGPKVLLNGLMCREPMILP